MRGRHQHPRLWRIVMTSIWRALGLPIHAFGGLKRYHAPPIYVGQPMRGRPNRRIIGREVHKGFEYSLHSTKGYRRTHA